MSKHSYLFMYFFPGYLEIYFKNTVNMGVIEF